MDAEGLRAWIREHRVCWELSPHVEVHEHSRVQVGFDLTLSARHPEGLADGPGCQICRRHYETLCEIAQAAVPKDEQATRCVFAPFDASVHLRPETRWTPEIELNVAILHRDATFTDIDDDERRCAAQIEQELRRLGAQPGTWARAEARPEPDPPLVRRRETEEERRHHAARNMAS
jgi:hypothetical protein